jgi:hypothetical protein
MTSCSLMKFLDHTKASTGVSAGLLLALTHINGDEDSRRISKAGLVKLAGRRLAVIGLVESQARGSSFCISFNV